MMAFLARYQFIIEYRIEENISFSNNLHSVYMRNNPAVTTSTEQAT